MAKRKEIPPLSGCNVADVDETLMRLSWTKYPRYKEDILVLIKRREVIRESGDVAMHDRYESILKDLIRYVLSDRATKCQPTRTTSHFVASLIEDNTKGVKYFHKRRKEIFDFLNKVRKTRETFEILSALRLYLHYNPSPIVGDRKELAKRAIAARKYYRYIKHTLIPVYGCIMQ